MDIFCLNLITEYGIKAVIIALISASASMILNRILKNKNNFLATYFPIILSIILEIVYDSCFIYNGLILNEEIVYSGILSGSLSTAFTVLIKRILNNKSVDFNKDEYAVIGLLGNLVEEKDKESVAKLIVEVLNKNKNKLTYVELSNEIKTQIESKLHLSFTDDNVLLLLSKILQASHK